MNENYEESIEIEQEEIVVDLVFTDNFGNLTGFFNRNIVIEYRGVSDFSEIKLYNLEKEEVVHRRVTWMSIENRTYNQIMEIGQITANVDYLAMMMDIDL